MTVRRPALDVSRSARSSVSGAPTRPKPPTMIVLPSRMASTASPAEHRLGLAMASVAAISDDQQVEGERVQALGARLGDEDGVLDVDGCVAGDEGPRVDR